MPERLARLETSAEHQHVRRRLGRRLDAAKRLVYQHSRARTESLYRVGAGITTLRVQDPNPGAVDDGKVLGVRIDIFDPGAFSYLLWGRVEVEVEVEVESRDGTIFTFFLASSWPAIAMTFSSYGKVLRIVLKISPPP